MGAGIGTGQPFFGRTRIRFYRWGGGFQRWRARGSDRVLLAVMVVAVMVSVVGAVVTVVAVMEVQWPFGIKIGIRRIGDGGGVGMEGGGKKIDIDVEVCAFFLSTTFPTTLFFVCVSELGATEHTWGD